MNEDKRLYPLRLCALQDDYAWGGETFRLADLGYRDSPIHDGWLSGNDLSEVMDTYMERVVGDRVFEQYGRQFPVCVRHLKVRGRMPLRVHPADEIAADRYDFLGKEKFWYVLRAGRDARVYMGWRRDVDASEVMAACPTDAVEDLLNVVAPHAGQYFRIAPGTVHAAAGDIELLEVSESSPMDFCLSAWGGEASADEFDPELSVIDALDFIDYSAYRHVECGTGQIAAGCTNLVSLPQFDVNRIELRDPLKVDLGDSASFNVYVCAGGDATVQADDENYAFQVGEAVLVPAECQEYVLLARSESTVLLEVTVTAHEVPDAYINPGVEASLPDEE